MPSKTITVTNGDGSTKTITIPDRSRFAGIRTMSRVTDGVTHNITVDRTAQVVTSDRKGESRPLLTKVVGGASAAYSLRDLNDRAGKNKVVRVRRASDNSEKDFRAKEVKDIATWANAQVVPPLDVRELVDGERTGDLVEASAAYSLRNLSTSYTGNVVDVRRSSDNAEDSFTAAEVADGTLEDWVTANQSGRFNFASGNNSWLSYDGGTNDIYKLSTYGNSSLKQAYDHIADADSIGSSPTSDSDYSYKFDSRVSGGYNPAHGLKVETREDNVIPFNVTFKYFVPEGQPDIRVLYTSLISGSYSTKGAWTEITVRNSNYVQNGALIRSLEYNSTGGLFYIADVRITSDTSNGFVSQWYDQSGNGNHATQGTDASQPKIVDGGVLVSGGLSIDSGQHLSTTLSGTTFALNNASSFVLGAANGGQGVGALTSIHSVSQFSTPYRYSSTQGFRYGGESTSPQPRDNSVQLFTLIGGSTTAEGFANGTSYRSTASSSGAYTNPSFKIGSYSGNLITGEVAEIIIYNSDQSDNRTAIEANIGETYGIDLPSGVDTGYDQVDGFVETWYDQSGNGNDATQSVSGSQPKIVDAGVLVSGGVDFDGVNDVLNTSLIPPSTATLIGVSNWDIEDVATMIIGARDSTNLRSYISQTSGGKTAIGVANGALDSIDVVASTDYLLFGMYSGADRLISVNSNPTSETILQDTPINEIYGYSIGALNTAGVDSAFMDGTIAEVIVYASDESANREAIEANINNQYDIY